MPKSLKKLQNKFLVRVHILDSAFDRHIINPTAVYRIDRFALQEGLLSSLWQAWCWFCRETVITSVQGALTESGALTTSVYSTNTEMEIAYIAKQLSNNVQLGHVRALAGRHLEPTWGDALKLNKITIGVNASNSSTLTSAFSAGTAITDLQLCRNANSHLSINTINDVRAARVRYNDTVFKHPSDMMKWTEPSTRDYLWKAWIDEISLISELAIQ